jgi:hypothetical protein
MIFRHEWGWILYIDASEAQGVNAQTTLEVTSVALTQFLCCGVTLILLDLNVNYVSHR